MKKFLWAALLMVCCHFYSLNAQTNSGNHLYPKWRAGLSGYFGYRVGKTAPGIEANYVKQIRQGADLNADASYYFKSSSAIGLKYSSFWSAGATFTSNPNMISNIKISYIGPALYTNIPLHSRRSLLSYGISLGYMRYTDDGWINHEKTLIKGNTSGALVELCYDLRIYKSLFAGVNAGALGGVLSKVNLNGRTMTLNKDQKESLSRVYAGIGLRFIR